ncbi:hypothetical protein VNO77_13608 [Canavalia gladiata]|uniref:Uncharacterized protein n=1 Tax=Canavalia gladiata TaxID=3824 RepID=A0AAN9LXZ9_CANGL
MIYCFMLSTANSNFHPRTDLTGRWKNAGSIKESFDNINGILQNDTNTMAMDIGFAKRCTFQLALARDEERSNIYLYSYIRHLDLEHNLYGTGEGRATLSREDKGSRSE